MEYLEKEQVINKIDEIEYTIQSSLFDKFDVWLEYEILTWRWWLGFGLTIVPWIFFWYVFRNKPYLDRLLYVCFFVTIISVLLDTLGDQYGLWHYRYNVIAAVPSYFPWDFTLMPFSVVMLLRIKPKARPWVKAIIFALLTSLVGEPIFNWLDVYSLDNWKYIYSVPIQFMIYLITHWLFTTRNKFSSPDNQ
jgi:hypothetical protein